MKMLFRDELSGEFEVRPYQLGDEEEIVPLLQLVFDGWPHLDLDCEPMDHWRWKYKDNPFRKVFIALGISNDNVIGCHHSIPLRIKIGNRIFLCSTSVDFAVHPEFRRIGVSKKLFNLNIKSRDKAGVKLAYYITGNPIVIKSQLRGGYPRFPHRVINLVRVRDIDLQLRMIPVKNAWLITLGYYLVRLFKILGNTIRGKQYEKHDVHIYKIDSFDERVDEFWEKVSEHYEFIVEKRMDFLNWRYCDYRGGDFVVRQAECEGRILGYCVLRINKYRKEYPIGYIIDLLALPNRLDVVDALAADAVRYFNDQNVNLVNYQVVKGHSYEQILMRHGFIDSRIKIQLFYTPQKEDILDKIDKVQADKVYLSWGEHDTLPVRMPTFV